MARYKIFNILDGTKVVSRGTAKEIAELFGVTLASVYRSVCEGRKFKGYTVVSTTEYTDKRALNSAVEIEEKKPVERKPRKEKEKSLTEYGLLVLVLHKRREDFCNINSNPKDMIPKLKEEYGLECICHEVTHNVGVKQRNRRKRKSYTVEVIRRGVHS